MTKIPRKDIKIYGDNDVNNLSQIGALRNGAAVPSFDPDVLQALSNYSGGLKDSVLASSNVPPAEDLNALWYLTTKELAYIQQVGIPEFSNTTTYFANKSIVRSPEATILYKSAIDNNLSNNIVGNSAYNAGTSYSIGDRVLDTNGDIYRSLTNSNMGNPLTDPVNWELIWVFLGDIANLKNLAQATTTQNGISLLPKRITISNGADIVHDIDFTAGNLIFDDGSGQAVVSALTKQIDAVWSEGDNLGGLDTGAVAIDTWYYLYAIYNPTSNTADGLFSASSTSPTMPAGYTKKKLVGVTLTNSSSNIEQFHQQGNLFNYVVPIRIFTGGSSGTPVVINNILPALKVEAVVGMFLQITGTGSTSFSTWGNLTNVTTQVQTSSIQTAQTVAIGSGILYADDGNITYQNFTLVGTVVTQRADLHSINIHNL